MPVDVTAEIVIDRARREVAEFAVDPERLPLWYTNIRSIEWQSEPPLAIGSRLAFTADFLRRRLAYTYEVTEHVPGERFVMRSAEGPFPMETTYTWRDAGELRTTMALRHRGTPRGIARLAAPIVRLAMRRAMRRDLALLKSILEARTRREERAATALRR